MRIFVSRSATDWCSGGPFPTRRARVASSAISVIDLCLHFGRRRRRRRIRRLRRSFRPRALGAVVRSVTISASDVRARSTRRAPVTISSGIPAGRRRCRDRQRNAPNARKPRKAGTESATTLGHAGLQERGEHREAASTPNAAASPPLSTPSMTNGRRMTPTVAPTIFMSSIISRRAMSVSLTVFATTTKELARRRRPGTCR